MQVTNTNVLTTLGCSGDVGAEVAAMAVQSGQAQRDVARAARDADEAIQESEDEQEVAAMHQKADDVRSQALVEGFGMIAEGGFEVAGSTQGEAARKGLEGGGKIANGTAQIFAGGMKAAEANDDAAAAQHRAAAEHAKSAAEDMHDASRDAADYVKSAIDFYRDYVSSEAESRSAALHRA
jgi:hypothetical protein